MSTENVVEIEFDETPTSAPKNAKGGTERTPPPVEDDEALATRIEECRKKIDDAIAAYEGEGLPFNTCMARLAAVRSTVPDLVAASLGRIKKVANMPLPEIRKALDAASKALIAEQEEAEDEDGERIELSEDTFRTIFDAEYAVLNVRGKTGIINLSSIDPENGQVAPDVLGKEDFLLLFANRKIAVPDKDGGTKAVPATKLFLEWSGRKTFMGMDFLPNTECSATALNIWRGLSIDHTRRGGGSWELLRLHIFDNICEGNQAYYEWFMAWLADIFQHPQDKKGSAVVLRSKRGSGKSVLCEVLEKLLAPYTYTLADDRSYLGDWSDHLFGRLLIIAEEAVWGGDKRSEGKLKLLITRKKMEYARKYFSRMEVTNHARYLFVTNEKWSIPTGFDDERRFFMLDVKMDKKGNIKYFRDIKEQLDAGGYQAMLYDLMHWPEPAGGWDTLRIPPQTDALNSQKARGMSVVQEFFVEMINSGECTVAPDGDHIMKTVKLKLDEPNRIFYPALREALYRYVRGAGAVRDARPAAFQEAAAEVLLAVGKGGTPGKPKNALRGNVEAAPVLPPHVEVPKIDTVLCIEFPGLREIVEHHHKARNFMFDPIWMDDDEPADAGDDDHLKPTDDATDDRKTPIDDWRAKVAAFGERTVH